MQDNRKLWLLLATAIFVWAMLILISDNTQRWISLIINKQIHSEYSSDDTATTFNTMQSINPDFYAWLNMGDLSAPVVKGSDNIKYLTTTFDGRKDKRGTIFADYRNSRLGGTEPLVLYGHNFTSSDEMFAVVEKLTDIEYLSKNPYIYLDMVDGRRKYVIYTLFYADADPKASDYFPYHNLPFSDSNTALQELFSEINRRAIIKSNQTLDTFDSILMLSTCGYDYSSQRIVAVAKLVDTDFDTNPTYTHVEKPYRTEKHRRLYGG